MPVRSPRALRGSPSQQWEECYPITLGKEEEKNSRIKASPLNSLGGFCVFATESMALKTLCFNRKCQMFEQQRKKNLIFGFKYQELEHKRECRGKEGAPAPVS